MPPLFAMAKNKNIMLDVTCHPRDSKCNGPKVVLGLKEDFTSWALEKLSAAFYFWSAFKAS